MKRSRSNPLRMWISPEGEVRHVDHYAGFIHEDVANGVLRRQGLDPHRLGRDEQGHRLSSQRVLMEQGWVRCTPNGFAVRVPLTDLQPGAKRSLIKLLSWAESAHREKPLILWVDTPGGPSNYDIPQLVEAIAGRDAVDKMYKDLLDNRVPRDFDRWNAQPNPATNCTACGKRFRGASGLAWHQKNSCPARAKRPAHEKRAPKVQASKSSEVPSAKLLVRGAGVIITVGSNNDGSYVVKPRPFVVVQVEPGKNRPFYLSTGTGGETDKGEWVVFGGHAENGWFIKAIGGKRVEKYTEVVKALAKHLGTDVEEVIKRLRSINSQMFTQGARKDMVAYAKARNDLEDALDVARSGPGTWEEMRLRVQEVEETWGSRVDSMRKKLNYPWKEQVNSYLWKHKAIAEKNDPFPAQFRTVWPRRRAGEDR